MIGKPPTYVRYFPVDLPEVMYYLYLPVFMRDAAEISGQCLRIPAALEVLRPIIETAVQHAARPYKYVYVSARKGWATKDNPLNRPGWHCDGYGTDDLNYVWWKGPGTRFAVQKFADISKDHCESLKQFAEQVERRNTVTYGERALYCIDPEVVHATPVITEPCMRQYVKVSLSDQQYNLENNSHNYLFDYAWPMHSRETVRNDPYKAQGDYK